jgi:hypothetical protein
MHALIDRIRKKVQEGEPKWGIDWLEPLF